MTSAALQPYEAAGPQRHRPLWPAATLGTMLLLIAALTARLVDVTWSPRPAASESSMLLDSTSVAPITVSRMAARPVLSETRH